MGVGDKIDKDDYNRVYDVVSNILGTGSGSFGYGQTLTSGSVTTANKVSVSQWRDLQYDLITISRHQNGTIPTLPLPETGNKIKFNSTTEPVNKFETFVAGLSTNRFTINPTSLELGSFLSSSSGSISWKNSLVQTVTITWASINDARHFFNMGGEIQCTSTKSGGTRTGDSQTIADQNLSWESLVNDRIVTFKAVATTLSDSLDHKSFYRCGAVQAGAFFTLSPLSGDYDQNDYNVYAWTPDTTDNRNGSSRQLAMSFEYIDGHTPDGSATLDGVDGSMSVLVKIMTPSGRRYPNNQPFSIPAQPTIQFGTWDYT